MNALGQPPEVTVVIPCWNAETWAARAVESALAQPDVRVEVVAVDDGSADGTLAVLRGFGPRIRVETGPNRGAQAARNRGLALASSEFVVFLDADDALEGRILAGGLEAARREGADLVFAPMEVKRRDGTRSLVDVFDRADGAEALFDLWMDGNWVCPGAALWRTAFLRGIGGWDERALINQDGELVMRALLHGPGIARNAGGTCAYHVDNMGSISRSLGREKLRSYLEGLRRLAEMAAGTRFETRMRGVRLALYRVARLSFAGGWPDLGREALAEARRRGLRGHPGRRGHALACRILGLEAKVRLWGG